MGYLSVTDCILTYEQLLILNLPWIHDIEPGEKAFLRIIKKVDPFTEDSFQFTETNNSRLTFVQKLNGNPIPKVGQIVFTFGKWNLNRGFATTTELYHYQKAV